MNCLRIMSYLLFCMATLFSVAGDWVHWRGPNQNGYINAKDLPSSWSKSGENLLWEVPYGSRATPMIMGDRVYLINRAGTGEERQERVMALDLVTGKMIWEHRFNVFLTDIVEHRVGWAQLSGDPETGNIYSQGVQGLLMCFNRDGKVLWRKSLTEELGRISGYGGRTHSPLIEGDKLIIGSCYSSWGSFGPGKHRLMAMDKHSGEILWWHTSPGRMLDTTYSVPVVATLNGVRTLITGFADGTLGAVNVNTGERLWSYTLSKRGIQTSVIYHDGRVYATHSEENPANNEMGAVVCIDATKKGDITKTGAFWRIDGLAVGASSPALANGMLMVASNKGNLHALDAQTGARLWKFNYGTVAKGSPLVTDDKIYIGEVTGKYHVLGYDKKGCKLLSTEEFFAEDGSPIEIYSSASTADGRVFMSTKENTYCIGSKPGKPSPAKVRTWMSQDKPGKATQLLVIPAETYIAPGEKQTFVAKSFDAKGNLVGETKAEWSLKGLKGTIKDGVFSAATSDATQGGMVMAKVGDLKASARLRVVPKLPYSQNFESLPEGLPPAGWISSKLKSQVVTKDGSKVLKKMSDRMHPAFARMRNYMMPPLEPGFTVQSDLFGESKKRRFWPDMGLINCRYMLRLMGTTRKPVVRLVSWDPMPRIQQDVSFDWKPDVWYTAKLAYSIVDGKGMVRGKVWPRGEAEPEAWTIEMVDSIPNTGGSPGLYGYSTAISETSPGTPVYFDNVKIFKNK